MKLLHYIILLSCALLPVAGIAQGANDVLQDVIDTYNKSKGISADYLMTYDKTTDRGTIAMEGDRFRILSDDLMCWYDGTTQWAYSSMTGEVNITEPTREELQLSNPYAALVAFKNSSNVSMVKTPGGAYMLSLIPQLQDSDVRLIQLFVGIASKQIEKAVFVMADNSQYTVVVKNYATGKKFPGSTFKYDAGAVPAGTQVVDLR